MQPSQLSPILVSVFSLLRSCSSSLVLSLSPSILSHHTEALLSQQHQLIHDAGSSCLLRSRPQAMPPRGASRRRILVASRRLNPIVSGPRPLIANNQNSRSKGSTPPLLSVSPSTREPRTQRYVGARSRCGRSVFSDVIGWSRGSPMKITQNDNACNDTLYHSIAHFLTIQPGQLPCQLDRG